MTPDRTCWLCVMRVHSEHTYATYLASSRSDSKDDLKIDREWEHEMRERYGAYDER